MKTNRRSFIFGALGAAAAAGCRSFPSVSSKKGWVDLQVNGRVGVSFNDPFLTVEQVKKVAEILSADGTEHFLPTVCTCSDETACRCLGTIRAAMRKYPVCAHAILGVHMEGPFISDVPGYSGAHDRRLVRDPDTAVYDRWMDASDGLVRLVTVCGLRKGAEAFVRHAASSGTVVSLGHSPITKTEDLNRLAAAGAKTFTHLGNAMPNQVPRHHNQIWTVLANPNYTPMFISDGFHLPKEMLRIYVRSRPIGELVTVSDTSHLGGLPPGRYERNGHVSILEESGFLRSPGTNSLDGSTCLMAKCVKVLNSPEVGLSMAECELVARENPLKLINA